MLVIKKFTDVISRLAARVTMLDQAIEGTRPYPPNAPTPLASPTRPPGAALSDTQVISAGKSYKAPGAALSDTQVISESQATTVPYRESQEEVTLETKVDAGIQPERPSILELQEPPS